MTGRHSAEEKSLGLTPKQMLERGLIEQREFDAAGPRSIPTSATAHVSASGARSLAERLGMPTLAAVIHGPVPDMESRARLFNEGFATARAMDESDDPSDGDEIDALLEDYPDPVVYEDANGEARIVVLADKGYRLSAADRVLAWQEADGEKRAVTLQRRAS